MAGIDIRIDGADKLARRFSDYVRTSPGTFDKTTGRWAKRTANQLKKKKYPPTRSGQKYKRTRRLKRGWEARRVKSSQWTISNRAQAKGRVYPGFVVGDNQAWMHKGRWWIASEEIEAKIPNLVKALEDDIKRLLGG